MQLVLVLNKIARMGIVIGLCSMLLAGGFSERLWANTVFSSQFSSVSILADQTGVSDKPLYVALKFQPQAGYHTYWKNPGDFGQAPQWTLQSSLPIQLGAAIWSIPEKIMLNEQVNYGYRKSQWIVLPITLKKHPSKAKSLQLNLALNWLVCHDLCVPEFANLSLELPVLDHSKPSDYYEQIHQVLDQHQVLSDKNLSFENGQWMIQIPKQTQQGNLVDVFPEQNDRLQKDALASVTQQDTGIQVALRSASLESEDLNGIITIVGDQTKSYEFSFKSEMTLAKESLGVMLLFAFIGGLILNAMPCVFPVISLKLLHVMKVYHQGQKEIFKEGVAYLLGVLMTFMGLALLVIGLQSFGHVLGWGFQLQYPGFVLASALFVWILALIVWGHLSDKGVVISSSYLAAWIQSKIQRYPYFESIGTGVLATVLATPCTAPFLGPVIAFLLGAPKLVSIWVFLSLGLGFSFPFLILTFFPQYIRFLPASGLWQLRFKKLLVWPLFLTGVWLVWVLYRQTDWVGVWIFGISVVVVIGCLKIREGRYWPLIGLVFIGAIWAVSVQKTATVLLPPFAKAYSHKSLESYRSQGVPVLVDATAAWCLTCQFNEKNVLQDPEVAAFFENGTVIWMLADWTQKDPKITQYLATFNRRSVPAYVWYPAKQSPELLPTILTKKMLIERFSQQNNRQ